MSLGFGVGDVIAVSTLARSVWGRFRDSSDQFNAIQTEVAGLYLALDDIANNLSGLQATDKQVKDLSILTEGCRGVLDDTDQFILKNEILSTESSSLGSKTQKAWRKLKWDPARVSELRDRMVSNATFLNAFNTSLASQVSRATDAKVKIIAEDVQSLRLNQSQQKREEVLLWLSPLNFTSQQSDLSGRRQGGTGSWLLESQEFQEWVGNQGKTLVCQGMPGAGKTMLASLVINHLQRLSGKENVATAFIYCDYKRQDEQTPLNLTASIMKQLLQHQDFIPENILKMYQHHHEKGTRPSFEEVEEMIGSLMARLSRIYIIVDALDELGNAGQIRQTLIRRLRPLQDLHHFNLMITSRYIPSLALDFHQPLCMDVRASPEDIRTYVEGHILDLRKCVKENLVLQKAIASAIVDAVEGMFLLAQLHMDSLRDKTSSKLIRKALEILPKGSDALDLAYHGAMQRVEDQMEGVRVLAKQLLGWLTYSERLMTVEEIQHALAVEPGTPDFDEDNLGDIDEIVGFCAGLVIIDEETQIIRLVHYTTQEYFRRNGDKILTSAQQDIAISCLTYLLYEEYRDGWVVEVEKEENIEGDNGGDAPRNEDEYEDEDFFRPWSGKSRKSVEARVQKHPFLEYAARYWVTHAILCEQPNVTELMMTLVKDDRRVSSASQVLFFLDREFDILEMFDRIKSRSSLSAMHVLAYLGFEEMISELLNHGIEADDEDSAQRTPLWWAASRGHHAAVELLLSQNHVNANNRGLAYDETCNQVSARTPLGMVAESGKDKVVKLLIEREDVDVNLSDGYGNSPLSLAARGGHGTVVELLLTRRDIDVNLTNSLDEVPLSLAAFHGREDIVKQLLKREHVQINSRDIIGRTPLALAASEGHEGVVRILLGRSDVEVNWKDDWGRNPLFNAVRGGFEAVVQLLLSHTDVVVHSKTGGGRTNLHHAAERGYASIVQLLMSRTDLDVNSKTKAGQTALHIAAKAGHASTVDALLGCVDIDVNPKDMNGSTPLHVAAERGCASIVELLMSHTDIEVNSTDKSGQTALYKALNHDYASIVELLLGCVDIDVKPKDENPDIYNS